jgi:hypothetical protein
MGISLGQDISFAESRTVERRVKSRERSLRKSNKMHAQRIADRIERHLNQSGAHHRASYEITVHIAGEGGKAVTDFTANIPSR